jgi:hypothetical protein
MEEREQEKPDRQAQAQAEAILELSLLAEDRIQGS